MGFQIDTGGTLETGLVAYWPMEEASGVTRGDALAVHDLLDDGANPVTQTTGIVSNAGEYTLLSGSFLREADTAGLSGSDRDFTIAGWFYLDAKGTLRGAVGKGDWNIGTDREYLMDFNVNNNRFRWQVRNAADSSDTPVSANNLGSPALATWYFIEMYHDATLDEIGIRVNNGTFDTAAHAGGVNNGAEDFLVGAYGTGGGAGSFKWDGRVDELGFWDKRLIAQEGTDLYNGGSGQTFVLPVEVTKTIDADTDVDGTTTQTIDADSDVVEETLQTIEADSTVLDGQPSQTIDADTLVNGESEQQINAATTVLDGIVSQTINADTDIISGNPSQTIDADTSVEGTVTQTIDSESFIQVVDVTQIIGGNTDIILETEQTISALTHILVREVDLVLFKESDLSTPVGPSSNRLDFDTVEAGTIEQNVDNPFVLFNDKGAVVNSVDAQNVKISVLQLDIMDELVGTSTGGASQMFTVAFSPTIDDNELIIVKVDDVSWTRVTSLVSFGATDEVYLFDAPTGEVTFGDGIQGKIPPLNDTIKITYTPNTVHYGKEVAENLWISVQSNDVIANDVTVELEERIPDDVDHVTIIHAPVVVSVSGVFLITDPNRLGTNFFTSGAFDSQTGIITLGTSLPSSDSVLVDYVYTIEDDAEGGFTAIGKTVSHTFANPIPTNNAKKLNFQISPPATASPSGGTDIRFKVRIEYTE